MFSCRQFFPIGIFIFDHRLLDTRLRKTQGCWHVHLHLSGRKCK